MKGHSQIHPILALLLILFMIAINLVLLGGVVWVIVTVLRWMGVLA